MERVHKKVPKIQLFKAIQNLNAFSKNKVLNQWEINIKYVMAQAYTTSAKHSTLFITM